MGYSAKYNNILFIAHGKIRSLENLIKSEKMDNDVLFGKLLWIRVIFSTEYNKFISVHINHEIEIVTKSHIIILYC